MMRAKTLHNIIRDAADHSFCYWDTQFLENPATAGKEADLRIDYIYYILSGIADKTGDKELRAKCRAACDTLLKVQKLISDVMPKEEEDE